jgi:hypothetical protein
LCMLGAGGERAYNVLRGEVHMGEGRAGDHSMASARYNLGVIPSVNTARACAAKKKESLRCVISGKIMLGWLVYREGCGRRTY